MRIKFLQEFIDRIRGKIFAGSNMYRKYYCFTNSKNYTTLALGSFHMEWGFIPDLDEINMGSASQDLYYSYNLYKLADHSKLKNILITFSVFSPNDILLKSSSDEMCILFKVLFGIDYQINSIATEKNLDAKLNYYKNAIDRYRKVVQIPKGYNGSVLGKQHIDKDTKKIHERALAHYKINRKVSNQMDYCLKLLEDTKNNQQNILFILPPATESYKEVLPKSNIIFESLYKMVEGFPHARILNLYDSRIFVDDDFADGDHLLESGRIKMTREMRKVLNND